MRDVLVAILGTEGSTERCWGLVDQVLGPGKYKIWSQPIPRHYAPHPWEIRKLALGVNEDFSLFRPESGFEPMSFALDLSSVQKGRAVLLFMSAEVDTLPGVGSVQRPGGGAIFKMYLNGRPVFKIGVGDDVEVPYRMPSLRSERIPMVVSELEASLGDYLEPFRTTLDSDLAQNTLSPISMLQVFGLDPQMGIAWESRCLLHVASPLAQNSPDGGG